MGVKLSTLWPEEETDLREALTHLSFPFSP